MTLSLENPNSLRCAAVLLFLFPSNSLVGQVNLDRFKVITTHGTGKTIWQIVDFHAPDSQQPAILEMGKPFKTYEAACYWCEILNNVEKQVETRKRGSIQTNKDVS